MYNISCYLIFYMLLYYCCNFLYFILYSYEPFHNIFHYIIHMISLQEPHNEPKAWRSVNMSHHMKHSGLSAFDHSDALRKQADVVDTRHTAALGRAVILKFTFLCVTYSVLLTPQLFVCLNCPVLHIKSCHTDGKHSGAFTVKLWEVFIQDTGNAHFVISIL